jgi:formyl-CoA transferase
VDSTLADGTPVQVPGVLPKLNATPGTIRTLAPELGQHTDEVLATLGLDDAKRAALRERGII